MAKVELSNGIFRILSGTINKRTYQGPDGIHTVRTYAKTMNGKTRIYVRDEKPRNTPPTKATLLTRQRFSDCARICRDLSPEQRQTYHDQWVAAKYIFRGKNYNTLRGYIIARLYADTPAVDTKQKIGRESDLTRNQTNSL